VNAIHALSQLSYGPLWSEKEAERQKPGEFRPLPIRATHLGPATCRFKKNAKPAGKPLRVGIFGFRA
jgi:hypothetical protein